MTEVKSLEQLSILLGYIVPGLIIIYVRAQFLTGRIGPHKDALLNYFTLSVVYLAIISTILTIFAGTDALLYEQTRYRLLILLGGSFVFGILIGLNASLGASRWCLARLGLNLPHVIESAWDWRFSRFPPTLLMVTLKDGSQVAGWCGKASFVGSFPNDMYLEQVYNVDDQGNWIVNTRGKGIYITEGEVRLIEFVPRSAGVSE